MTEQAHKATSVTIAVPETSALEALQSSLRGELICPHDRGYDTARRVWNGMIDNYPALIIREIHPLLWRLEIVGEPIKCAEASGRRERSRRGRRQLRTAQSDIKKGQTVRSRGPGLSTFDLLYLEQLYK
jgi:hypothetical protein